MVRSFVGGGGAPFDLAAAAASLSLSLQVAEEGEAEFMGVMRNLEVFSLLLAVLAVVATAACGAPDSVTSEGEALSLYARARQDLVGMGLKIPREIPLKYRTRDEVLVENNSTGGRAIDIEGFYRPYNPEEIWIVSGLSQPRTIGAMAHELTHAWQSTESPLQDRKLKEGFARWVQYKVLVAEGHGRFAAGLRRDADPDYGGGLRALLEIEERQGTPAVIEVARRKTAI